MQKLHELRLGCDTGVVIPVVEQIGGIACHIDWESCFYRVFESDVWKTVDSVLKDPDAIYKHTGHHHS